MRPGPLNLITDVPGLRVGNAEDSFLKSGVSVVTAAAPMVASVSVMGGAPGTRETDLLAPDKSAPGVDALVLSGGSAFGLAAAQGVMDALHEEGRGFEVFSARVPIVPAAILFDLLNGGDKRWGVNPYPGLGRQALANVGISRIVFLAFDESLHIGRWDEPYIMAKFADLPAPEMRTVTGFHRDNAGRQLSEECRDLISSQLLAQHRPARDVGSMNLKDILRKIEPDRDNFRHARPPLWIIADPPWHTDAVGGRSHHQSQQSSKRRTVRLFRGAPHFVSAQRFNRGSAAAAGAVGLRRPAPRRARARDHCAARRCAVQSGALSSSAGTAR